MEILHRRRYLNDIIINGNQSATIVNSVAKGWTYDHFHLFFSLHFVSLEFVDLFADFLNCACISVKKVH